MINVAIVDGDKELNNTLFSILKSAGADVVEQFYSEREFLNTLPLLKSEIVLIDITLPCYNLVDFISKIKELKPGIKAVIISAWVQHDLIYKTICAGASGYINKFGDKNYFINAISEIASGQAQLSLPIAQLICNKFLNNAVTIFTVLQLQIIKQIASGLPYTTVAAAINQSNREVLQHISTIYSKLHYASK